MKNDFSIPGTQSTPLIKVDWVQGTLSMQGDSYPENAVELFGRVVDWVARYLAETDRLLQLELRLLYLNTSSVKTMMDIFDLLEAAHRSGRKVAVHWYYDQRNERVAQLAEEFKEDFSFPFNIIARDT